MRPLVRTLDKEALRDNWRTIRARATAKNIFAVIKSRAYGHGLLFAAEALRELADGFAVVEMVDARALRTRDIDKPILLMSGPFNADEASQLASLRLWTAVCDERQARWIAALPADSHLTVFVKVDVGMNRLGVALDEADAILNAMTQAPAVARVALMAHFADADRADGLQAPLHLLSDLRRRVATLSLGNSAATLLHNDIGDDWARVGIALYGSSPAPARCHRDSLGLRPVMTLQTALIATRLIRAGAGAGYGGIWHAKQDTRVGIAACGYGDGYPRAEGKRLQVAINGRLAPVLGRVSMELIIIDLTNCPGAAIGDEVVCWGDMPSIDEVATAAGRISYELLTAAVRDG